MADGKCYLVNVQDQNALDISSLVLSVKQKKVTLCTCLISTVAKII